MKSSRLILCFCLGMLLIVMAAACTSGASEETQQQEAPKAAASGLAEGKTLYLATLTESGDSPPKSQTETQTIVGTVDQWRDQPRTYSQEASDERVAGDMEVVIQSDSRADGSGDLWGTFVLKNTDGSWEGDFSGPWAASRAYVPDVFYLRMRATGGGKYEGLELEQHGYRAQDVGEVFSPGTDFVFTGWIQKTE